MLTYATVFTPQVQFCHLKHFFLILKIKHINIIENSDPEKHKKENSSHHYS